MGNLQDLQRCNDHLHSRIFPCTTSRYNNGSVTKNVDSPRWTSWTAWNSTVPWPISPTLSPDGARQPKPSNTANPSMTFSMRMPKRCVARDRKPSLRRKKPSPPRSGKGSGARIRLGGSAIAQPPRKTGLPMNSTSSARSPQIEESSNINPRHARSFERSSVAPSA